MMEEAIPLPPLPEFDDWNYPHNQGAIDLVGSYSVEAMQAYARQAVLMERADKERLLALQKASYEREIQLEISAERERCAAICERVAFKDCHQWRRDTVNECIAAIRAPVVDKTAAIRATNDALVAKIRGK